MIGSKHTISLISLILFVGILCSKAQHNQELDLMYKNDQLDRDTNQVDWSTVSRKDSIRRQRVKELLDSNKIITAKDYSNAAMIFQHGKDTIDSKMAVQLMYKAVKLDSAINKWLLAAAIDRDLMRKGKPQIYGTQFIKMHDEPWTLYELDSTKITDKQRVEYGVETLERQKEKLKELNK